MYIFFDVYVTKGQNKQTNLADLQFLLNYALFSKNCCRKLLKKNLKYKSILYNSTGLSVDWTSREFQNQGIVFSRKNQGTLSDLRQFLTTESPLLMIRNAFYLPWKLFLFSRYLSFRLDFLIMYQKNLIRKIRLILKFMTPQPGWKNLQYTYWPISQEVKTTRQWNLAS